MLKKSLVACAFVLMSAPALADPCSEPIAPAAIDGATATEAQMKAAVADVKTFIKDSDDYQTCLLADLTAQKRAAKNQKDKDKQKLDPGVEAAVQAKIDTNQKLKERVGAEYNAAVVAFKAKHP
jgi:hypothetical protein